MYQRQKGTKRYYDPLCELVVEPHFESQQQVEDRVVEKNQENVKLLDA